MTFWSHFDPSCCTSVVPSCRPYSICSMQKKKKNLQGGRGEAPTTDWPFSLSFFFVEGRSQNFSAGSSSVEFPRVLELPPKKCTGITTITKGLNMMTMIQRRTRRNNNVREAASTTCTNCSSTSAAAALLLKAPYEMQSAHDSIQS